MLSMHMVTKCQERTSTVVTVTDIGIGKDFMDVEYRELRSLRREVEDALHAAGYVELSDEE